MTTGPMVFLSVDGHLPGDAIDVKPGTTLHVTAEALGKTDQVPLTSLDIVGDGGKVLAHAGGGTDTRLTASLDIAADRGMWIAAKAAGGVGQVAHTTPVYVTVNGGGFLNTAALDPQRPDGRVVPEGDRRGSGASRDSDRQSDYTPQGGD